MKSPALFLNNSLYKAARNLGTQAINTKYVNQAQNGRDNFKKDYQNSHIPTSLFQKVLLGIGSGVLSFTSPTRGDMVAVMGEITGAKALEYMRIRMLESEEGRKILDERPRISSATVDLEKLRTYPEGTIGKTYMEFLDRYGYSPDERNAVRFVDDIELAYVAQRYREVHDLLHTVFYMPTHMLGEVTVKWVEAIQTRLPMCVTGALFGSARLAPKFSRFYSTNVRLRMSPELSEQVESNSMNPKHHPGVMKILCQKIPDEIMHGITMSLDGKDIKYLIENGQSLHRKLMGRHVPLEKHFHLEKKNVIEQNVYEQYKVTDLNDLSPQLRNKIKNTIIKKFNYHTYNWKSFKYDSNKCLQYLVIRAPAEYAAVKRVFNEILLRDKDFQPQAIFDFGSGVGTVVWAAHQLWGSSIQEYFCVDSSRHMNDLASFILKPDELQETPVIKNIYYRQFLPMTPRPYDIVVSSFSLFELESSMERFKLLTVLWNNTQRYLVLIENGTNAGHDILDEAREYLISMSEEHEVDCHVFAPCPHDSPCPRLSVLGKRTPCNFIVSYHQLPISEPKNSTSKLPISFLILKKGKPPPEEERQSRIVREVLKRHRHVVCHLCTNKGELRTVFVSASKNGKSTYKCMRQSNWGDLTPPGSKLEILEDDGELISDEDTDSDEAADSNNDDNKTNTKNE